MKTHTVKIAITTSKFNIEQFSKFKPNFELEIKNNPYGRKLTVEEVFDFVQDADAVIAGLETYDDVILSKLTNLKCISRVGIGLDNIDLKYTEQNGIKVFNTPTIPVPGVVEHTLALIFSILKKVCVFNVHMKKGNWCKLETTMLKGKTVGIVGYGKIGKEVVKVLRLLGCKVLIFDSSIDIFEFDFVPLKELMKRSEIITYHIPGTTENIGMFNFESLEEIMNGTIIINTSRGGIVDEKALYKGLKSGRIGGAALDVFEVEPYTGPLGEFDNVILTPHVSTSSIEIRDQMEIEAIRQLIDFFSL